VCTPRHPPVSWNPPSFPRARQGHSCRRSRFPLRTAAATARRTESAWATVRFPSARSATTPEMATPCRWRCRSREGRCQWSVFGPRPGQTSAINHPRATITGDAPALALGWAPPIAHRRIRLPELPSILTRSSGPSGPNLQSGWFLKFARGVRRARAELRAIRKKPNGLSTSYDILAAGTLGTAWNCDALPHTDYLIAQRRTCAGFSRAPRPSDRAQRALLARPSPSGVGGEPRASQRLPSRFELETIECPRFR